jgi:hypothetical protein
MLKIRPLNRDDLKEFVHMGFTVRGLAVELDGEVVGIAGVLHSYPIQAFSRMDDKLRKYPKTIVKVIKMFKAIVDKYDSPIYAIASEKEHNSTKVLERIGFEFFYKNEKGRFYRIGVDNGHDV